MTKNIIRPKIGLFGGIFDSGGKLLVKRRPSHVSSPGDWDLPGGGANGDLSPSIIDERIIVQELGREVKEETGISIPVLPRMIPMFPAVIKGGDDWAFAISVGEVGQQPSKGEWRYVDPHELRKLAEGPKGNQLVGGWGNRMSRLCLRLFIAGSPRSAYKREAADLLDGIEKSRP